MKHIDYISGNNWFGFDEDNIYFSSDAGQNYSTKAFANAEYICMSYIFDNGYVVFGIGNTVTSQLFQWKAKIDDPTEVVAIDMEDEIYVINAAWTGLFNNIRYFRKEHPNDVEKLVYGNYTNVYATSSPVNIYELMIVSDNIRCRVIYQFGVNPRYAGNGGDSENEIFCRHVHDVIYDSTNDCYYGCTGDADVLTEHECHWFKLLYNSELDNYSFSLLFSSGDDSYIKSSSFNIYDGYLYWGSDSTGDESKYGAYKCPLISIDDDNTHEIIFTDTEIIGEIQISNYETVVRIAATNQIYISDNLLITKNKFFNIGTAGIGVRVLSHRLENGKYLFQDAAFPRSWDTSSYLLTITHNSRLIIDTI